MPIIIKELHIKVTVLDISNLESEGPQTSIITKNQEMKSEIVKECVHRVLEKIKENQER